MQIKVKPFNQEVYEQSIARVLPRLELADKRAVRNSLLAINDAIEDAIEIQKRLDSIDLNERIAQVKPKKIETEEPIEEDDKDVFELTDDDEIIKPRRK